MQSETMPYSILRELPWTARELCYHARQTKCRSKLRRAHWSRYASGQLSIAHHGRLAMAAATMDGKSVIYLPA